GQAARLTLDLPFTERQKSDLVAGCYELLLTLAEMAVLVPAASVAERQAHAREALHLLDGASGLGITTQAYHRRRARYLEELGDVAGAAAEKNRATTLQTSTALDHFLQGDELYQQGDLAGAAQSFLTSLGQDPGSYWAQYLLAVCYVRLARPA